MDQLLTNTPINDLQNGLEDGGTTSGYVSGQAFSDTSSDSGYNLEQTTMPLSPLAETTEFYPAEPQPKVIQQQPLQIVMPGQIGGNKQRINVVKLIKKGEQAHSNNNQGPHILANAGAAADDDVNLSTLERNFFLTTSFLLQILTTTRALCKL